MKGKLEKEERDKLVAAGQQLKEALGTVEEKVGTAATWTPAREEPHLAAQQVFRVSGGAVARSAHMAVLPLALRTWLRS